LISLFAALGSLVSYYAAAGGHLLEKTETMHSSYQFSKEGKRLIASSSIHSLNKK
jgi:hypothetical protein